MARDFIANNFRFKAIHRKQALLTTTSALVIAGILAGAHPASAQTITVGTQTGPVTINAGGSYSAAGTADFANGGANFDLTITAAGSLTTTAANAIINVGTLTSEGNFIYNGSADLTASAVGVNGGAAVFGSPLNVTGALAVTGGAVVQFSNATHEADSFSFSDSGTQVLVDTGGTLTAVNGVVVSNEAQFLANSNVTIDGDVTVESNGEASLEGEITGNLDVGVDGNAVTPATGELDIGGDLTVGAGGEFAVASGLVTNADVGVAGDATVDGLLTVEGTLDIDGLLTVNSSGATGEVANTGLIRADRLILGASGTFTTDNDGDTVIQGSGSSSSAGTLSIASDGSFRVINGGTLDLSGTTTVADGELVMEGGLLTISDGTTTVQDGGLLNTDTGIDITAGTLEVQSGGEITNTGDIATSGTFTNAGNVTTTTLTIEEGGALTNSSTGNAGGGVGSGGAFGLAVSGAFTMDSGAGATATNTGAMEVGSVTLNDAAALTNDTGGDFDVTGNLTLNNTAALTSDGSFDVSGAVELNDQSTLTNDEAFDADTLTLNDQSMLTNNDEFDVDVTVTLNDGSMLTNDGEFDVTSDVTLNNQSILTNTGTSFDVDGSVTLNDGSTLNNEGGFETENGIQISDAGATLNQNTGTLVSNVTNDGGTVNLGGGDLDAGSVANNSGTFNMSGGTLSNSSPSSTVAVTNSGTFNMSGGTLSNVGPDTATVTNGGGGTFTMTGGDLTGNVTNSGTLFDMDGGTLTGNVTNSSTFDMDGGSLTGDVTNSSAFNVTGATLTGNVTSNSGALTVGSLGVITGNVDNSGMLNLEGTVGTSVTGGGTVTVTGNSATVSGNLQAGTVSLRGGGTGSGELLTVGGDLDATALQFNLTNVGGTLESDRIAMTGAAPTVDGTTLDFSGTDTAISGQTITVIQGIGTFDPADFQLTGDLGGVLVAYSIIANGDDLALQTQVQPAAGAISGQISVLQSLLTGVVNRPSSPLIAGLVFEAEDNRSEGAWVRAQGGTAEATSRTSNGFSNLPDTVSTSYGGIQFGYDSGKFDSFEGGQDIIIGGLAGYLKGSSSTDNFAVDPADPTQYQPGVVSTTKGEFTQAYAGGYLAWASGLFSGDVQLRYDRTDFEFNNTALDLTNAETSSDALTLSTSASYVYQVNDNVFLVPTGGLSITNTSTDPLTFTNAGGTPTARMTFPDHRTTLGFLGATAGYQTISEAGDSALTRFVTATVYSDMSGDRLSQFDLLDGSGITTDSSTLVTEDLGVFGEVSVGMNYVRILDDGQVGPARQLNAGVRLDARFSDRIGAYSLTAQARLQF